MYGLIKTCNFQGKKKEQWLSHYCGLCLALSKGHGQLARLATNSDSVIISALCEAQTPVLITRKPHYCLLRKQKKAEVITPDSLSSRYAALVSTLIASSKINDNFVDGDSWICHFPAFFKKIISHWSRSISSAADNLKVRVFQIEKAIYQQPALEAVPNKEFSFYSQGIEMATGLACSQTAVISGKPVNEKALFGLGKMYGRIIYLLDSYLDYQVDCQKKVFNPLAESYGSPDVQERAKNIFRSAYDEMIFYFDKLQLISPELCKTILEKNVAATGEVLLSNDLSQSDSSNSKNNSNMV